jgi:small subunit ribosomal protein S6
MRVYEELFIVRPNATEEEITPLVDQLTDLIAKNGGKVEAVEKWGVRKLAFRVKKQAEGYYILIKFEAGATLVKELERRLRLADLVLRYLTVRKDERVKKLVKRAKKREERLKRKPAPAAAAPAAPSMEQMMAQPAAPAMPGAPAPAEPAS